MKILFIEDLLEFSYPFSIGLLSLATILKENHYDVEILNFNYLFIDKIENCNIEPAEILEDMVEYITDKKPHVVGFTALCGSFLNIILLSHLIKNKDNKIKIILGGPQASIFPQKILQEIPWIDLICVGEGESKIEPIIKGLQNNDLTDVPGIVYRNNGTIIKNKDIDLISNLDTLPMLNYSLIPHFSKCNAIPLHIGRGCPYNCIYCSTSRFWKNKFRVKSIERICEEISYTKKLSGNDGTIFDFDHDNLLANYDFTMNLCKKLQKLNIEWYCSGRIDNLNEKLIKQMAMAGCREIFIGIESASPRIQTYMNKNLDLEETNKVIEILLNNHIKPTVSFMYGFPSETEEDLTLTLNMIYSLLKKEVYKCQFYALSILPGTSLFEKYKDNLVLQNYTSNIADNFNFKLYSSLIRKNKELFSYFYVIKDSLVEKYILLEKFIAYVFIPLYKFFPETFALILEHAFKNNILEFYNDFLSKSDNNFKDFFRSREYIKLRNPEIILNKRVKFLEMYINKKSDESVFKLIRNTFFKEMILSGMI